MYSLEEKSSVDSMMRSLTAQDVITYLKHGDAQVISTDILELINNSSRENKENHKGERCLDTRS